MDLHPVPPDNRNRRAKTVKHGNLAALQCAAVMALNLSCLEAQPPQTRAENEIAFELVGQVLNPSATQSLQYGYLNLLKGLDRITTQPGTVSETSALFTFYNDTATERVINNGPLRTIDRTGISTIYIDETGNNNFATPNNFRKGKPVQVSTLRHQVVIDIGSGYFTTIFENTITETKSFQIDGQTYYLGRPGQVYRIFVAGHLTTQSPPAAHIMGLASGRLLSIVPSQ
jgi:hypothetical protein